MAKLQWQGKYHHYHSGAIAKKLSYSQCNLDSENLSTEMGLQNPPESVEELIGYTRPMLFILRELQVGSWTQSQNNH